MIPQLSAGSLRVGRAFGIPIYVHFSWIVIFGLITWTLAAGYFPAHYPDLATASYWAQGLVASLLFFVSILLHELGHSVVALRAGIGIRSITLFIFGGLAQLEKEPEDGAAELRIAIAGPLVSFALAAGFHLVAAVEGLAPAAAAVARYLALINLVLAVFNLVPAFPLDGGRILRAALWSHLGKSRATRIASRAGSLFAFFLIFLGVFGLLAGAGIAAIWQILLGWFLKEASHGAYRGTLLEEQLDGLAVRDAMVGDVATLPAEIALDEAVREHFLRSGFGGYPVVRGARPVGLLCLRDVGRVPPEERARTTAQAAMTPLGEALVIAPDEPLFDALLRLPAAGGRLLVMDGERLVGLLPQTAVLRLLRAREALAS